MELNADVKDVFVEMNRKVEKALLGHFEPCRIHFPFKVLQ